MSILKLGSEYRGGEWGGGAQFEFLVNWFCFVSIIRWKMYDALAKVTCTLSKT